MATVIRKTDVWVQPLADGINALKKQVGAGAFFHLDASEVKPNAALATPVGLPACILALKDLIGVYTFHAADLLAHKVVDATTLPLVNDPVDLASCNIAANLLKVFHAEHIASTTDNYNADGTNTVLVANATTQGTLETLLAALQVGIAAHMASAPSAPSIRAIQA